MPFFVPDVYSEDLGSVPNFGALAQRADIVGVILKATQGITYAPSWFTQNWSRAKVAGIRGCYHFADPYSAGWQQADFVLAHVQRAGGLTDDDMPIAYDLEGSAWSSSQQIVDVASSFSARIKQSTGRAPILYTGAAVRDRGITNKMGFSSLWSPHLDMSKAGWPLSSYVLWQYAGDGKLYNPASAVYGFPLAIPGWGATDMNVVMDGGVFASSRSRAQQIVRGGGWGAFEIGLAAGGIALLYLLSEL